MAHPASGARKVLRGEFEADFLGTQHSVLVDARAHVHNYEAGGIAFHSQAVALPVSPSNGHTLTLEDLEPVAVLSESHLPSL